MYYNFVRVHQTLRVSLAMAAGVTTRLWEMADIVAVIEDWEAERARVKPIFEVREAAIGGNAYVQVTMPDGTSDQIFGFDSRDAAAEWIELEHRNWLRAALLTTHPAFTRQARRQSVRLRHRAHQ